MNHIKMWICIFSPPCLHENLMRSGKLYSRFDGIYGVSLVNFNETL